jgi:hypothetical protein
VDGDNGYEEKREIERMKKLLFGMLGLFVAACGANAPITETTSAIGLVTPYQLVAFNDGFEGVGVTGDRRLIFTGREPTDTEPAAVLVASRFGQVIGQVTPPPVVGFGSPAHQQVLSYTTRGASTSGTLLVIDDIASPPLSRPTAYVYSYSYSPHAGFSSTLTATHLLVGPAYVGGACSLPDGTLVLADALVGAMWLCDDNYVCHLGVTNAAWVPGMGGPFQGVGRRGPYTLALPGNILPGLLGVAYASATDEVCGYVVAPPGVISCVSRTVLIDSVTPPALKVVRALVAPQIGVTDGGHGITYDGWNPTSPWVYWVRALADTAGGGTNRIRRANLLTGEVQIVAESLTVMDFETGLTVLPPFFNGSPYTNLAVAMGQEENNAKINTQIMVSTFVTPTIVAGATILSQ